jgi:MFS family permease
VRKKFVRPRVDLNVLRRRPHYAWLIVLVTFVTLITTAGFRATPSVLIVPLQDEFGWSRATISLAVSLGLVMFGIAAPFSAALMERFGVQRVMLVALVTVATGASLTVFVQAPWQLDLLWGVVVGGATGAVSVPLAATIANRWFEERRGLVTGILTASSASGQLIFLPALALLVAGFGWRSASLAVSGVALLVVIPVVAVVMRDRPQSVGLLPYGATEETPAPERATRPFRPAIDGLLLGVRSRNFWLLGASFFICGLSTNGLIGTHLIAATVDHGMSAVAGASLLALIGGFDMIGTIASGWLTDRVDPRLLLLGYYGLRGLALLALPYVFGSNGLLVGFAVFYGLDWVATVPPTVALTADTFGRERVGVVFGWIFAMHQFGAASAAWVAGATRGWFGSYTFAFVSAGATCLLASLLVTQIEVTGVKLGLRANARLALAGRDGAA